MKRLVSLAVLLAVLGTCSRQQSPSVGPIREITVATDWWGGIEGSVRKMLQRRIPTPQPEPEFRLRVFPLDQFPTYSTFRTLLLVGTAQDSVLRGVLGSRIDSLPDDDFGLFRIPNAWAENQQLVVFVARDGKLLQAGLETYARRITETCRAAVLEHARRAVYHSGRNSRAEDSLLAEFSFTFDVPANWYLRQEHGSSGFIYMFGHHVDRNVFVYWDEANRRITPAGVVALRDSLTSQYYDGDFVEDSLTSADSVEFLSRPVLRVRGVWQNEDDTTGGPFVCYAFNHEGRFYLLDGLVFNPGRKKMDAVYQVEAVLRTFTPR